MMEAKSYFRKMWEDKDTPRMILLYLDGAGPFGDPYQVNSDNNGPYGDALTQELIPYVEAKFRGIGAGYARVTDGVSTGGCLTGVQAVGVPTPDFSPDARRLEDKVTHISGSIFLVGSILSVAALAASSLGVCTWAGPW